MRFAVAVIAGLVLTAGAASAKDVTVTFSDDEQKALYVVFDAALKANGMAGGVATNAVYLWDKMRAAAVAAEKSAPAAEPAK